MAPSRGSRLRQRIKFLYRLLDKHPNDANILRQIDKAEEELQYCGGAIKRAVIDLHQTPGLDKELVDPVDLQEFIDKYPVDEQTQSYGREGLLTPGHFYVDLYLFSKSFIASQYPPSYEFNALNRVFSSCGRSLFRLNDAFDGPQALADELQHIVEHGIPTSKYAVENYEEEDLQYVDSCPEYESAQTVIHYPSWIDEVEMADLHYAEVTECIIYHSETISSIDEPFFECSILEQLSLHSAKRSIVRSKLVHYNESPHSVLHDQQSPPSTDTECFGRDAVHDYISCVSVVFNKAGTQSIIQQYLRRFSVKIKPTICC